MMMPRPRVVRHPGRVRIGVLVLALSLVAASCGDGEDASSDRVRSSPVPGETATASPTDEAVPEATPAPPEATPEPPEEPPSDLEGVEVTASRVADLDGPLAMAVHPEDSTVYVAEKGGRVRRLSDGEVVLDVSGEVSGGSEQGLLGLAFSPDGNRLYVDLTDRDGDTVVREYRFSEGSADTGGAREVLTVVQPFSNHNGGDLTFGPEGHLWISLGDGGSGGDPQGNGQDTDTLLGSLLRIDPRSQDGQPYGIPDDNPFLGRDGRDEIWAYGLRNPWRFSFDRETDDLWIGDVGQNSWEEVDFEPAGASGGRNYGWNRLEGRHRFEGSPPPEHVLPIYEYPLEGGNCSVTGGYVYRGSRIPELRGAYVFADFCDGRIRALTQEDGELVDHRFLGPRIGNLASFGEDAGGELYALSLEGGVFRIEPA